MANSQKLSSRFGIWLSVTFGILALVGIVAAAGPAVALARLLVICRFDAFLFRLPPGPGSDLYPFLKEE